MWYSVNRKIARKQLPILKNITSLALVELNKISKAYETYKIKKTNYQVEIDRVESANKNTEKSNLQSAHLREQWRQKNIHPIDSELNRVEGALKDCEAGLISGIFTKNINYRGKLYKHAPGERLAKEHIAIAKRKNEIWQAEPTYPISAIERTPKQPRGETNIKIGGATFRINFDQLQIQVVNDLILEHKEKREDQKNKLMDLQARATSNEKEIRQQAQKFRRDLHNQLGKVASCPYCFGPLDDKNAHLDHIYPVSKGGQSTSKNLVFVCARCNLDKSDSTLRTFILTYKMKEAAIYSRLELLRKDF